MAANGAKVVVAEINAAGEQTAQIVSQAGGQCIAGHDRRESREEVVKKAAIETAVRHYGGFARPPPTRGWDRYKRITRWSRRRSRNSWRGKLARSVPGTFPRVRRYDKI